MGVSVKAVWLEGMRQPKPTTEDKGNGQSPRVQMDSPAGSQAGTARPGHEGHPRGTGSV